MKKDGTHLDVFRKAHPALGITESGDTAGLFLIKCPETGGLLYVISSGRAESTEDAGGWEHVSIHLKKRVPNWAEMCFIKDLFWGDDEHVVQYHPPKSHYVNIHPNTLHLWSLCDGSIPLPPIEMV